MSEQSAEMVAHDYRDQPGGRAPRCARCKVVAFDARWEFVVTWDPAVGRLPAPVAHLFRTRSTVDNGAGRAAHRTDRGHATHYVRAVNAYLGKHAPSRVADLLAVASEMGCEPRTPSDHAADCASVAYERPYPCDCSTPPGLGDQP